MVRIENIVRRSWRIAFPALQKSKSASRCRKRRKTDATVRFRAEIARDLEAMAPPPLARRDHRIDQPKTAGLRGS